MSLVVPDSTFRGFLTRVDQHHPVPVTLRGQEGEGHLGRMAGGFDGISTVKGAVGEGHIQKVALHRLAQSFQAQLHPPPPFHDTHSTAPQDFQRRSVEKLYGICRKFEENFIKVSEKTFSL